MDNKTKKIKSFTDLNAWKEGHKLVLMIYKITKNFPKGEVFGLTSQIRRAAISIVSNIAEGFSRQTYKDKVRFYFIAQGSLTEVQSQLLVARDLEYISEQDFKSIAEQTITVHKLLCGLIKKSKNIHNSQFTIRNSDNQKGIITPLVLVIASVMLVFAVSLISWSVSEHKDASRKIRTTQALQIAEAGVNYYKWHLEHSENDYQDGNDWCCDNNPDLSPADCSFVCGPYDHNYRDYCSGSDCEGNLIGQFSLKITPPEIGSTIVTVESSGYAYTNANNTKKITARVGKRSLAEYSWFSDAPMTFSATSEVSGPVHSNGEIEFRGVCSAEITSHIRVWGAGGPDSFWRWPVARVSFSNFLTDFNKIKKAAAMDNAAPPETIGTCAGDSGEGRGICYEGSGKRGYLVKFKDDATVSIYKVLSVFAIPNKERIKKLSSPLLENYPMPDNGLIFLGDDVWVEGTVNGKVTVAATKLWSGGGKARMIINGNITYADGRAGGDNLGLICEDDIIIPKHAPDTLTVDASLLSQYGKGLYFKWYVPNEKKDYIENYGGIVTYERSGVKWGNPVENGYEISKYIYNNNLSFSPPPFFPTKENFEVLSWEEE